MSRKHETLSSLQAQLKTDIVESLRGQVGEMCRNVVQKHIQRNVYDAYIPTGIHAYDRTYNLLNSVNIQVLSIGYKFVSFEIFMDTSKIIPNVTDDGEWNQHASVDPIDVSEYIPLWIEYGTDGSLWDREGTYYMEDSYFELSSTLYRALAKELRVKGWDVVSP